MVQRIEALPQSQCLVRAHAGHHGPTGVSCEVEDAALMSPELGHSAQGGVLVQGELVTRVTMGHSYLSMFLIPHQTRHLQADRSERQGGGTGSTLSEQCMQTPLCTGSCEWMGPLHVHMGMDAYYHVSPAVSSPVSWQ